MMRKLLVSSALFLAIGAGACGVITPHDYSKDSITRADPDRDGREARKERERQQSIIRCNSGGRNLPPEAC